MIHPESKLAAWLDHQVQASTQTATPSFHFNFPKKIGMKEKTNDKL